MRTFPARSKVGFSLVEVTLSIAIVAAVVLPLVALLSRGSSSVTDSEDRFATTRIIQSIESEIRYSRQDSAFFVGSKSSPSGGTIDDILVPATSGGSVFLGYDRSAKLIREVTSGEFSSGVSQVDSEILYLVELQISQATSNTAIGVPPLFRIRFSVEQPAFTSAENRTRTRLQTQLSGL